MGDFKTFPQPVNIQTRLCVLFFAYSKYKAFYRLFSGELSYILSLLFKKQESGWHYREKSHLKENWLTWLTLVSMKERILSCICEQIQVLDLFHKSFWDLDKNEKYSLVMYFDSHLFYYLRVISPRVCQYKHYLLLEYTVQIFPLSFLTTV